MRCAYEVRMLLFVDFVEGVERREVCIVSGGTRSFGVWRDRLQQRGRAEEMISERLGYVEA